LAVHAGATLAGAIGFYIIGYSIACIAVTLLLYVIVSLVARLPIRRFGRAALPAQLIAFSSSSSIAALPALVESAEVRLALPERVAGFVLPGTHVDVLVAVNDNGDENKKREPMARTVVSNVEVLTAGTRYDQDEAKNGKAQRSTVVTLAVLPSDGERVALASAQGQLSLVLRNPIDVDPAETTGIKLAALMKGTGPEPILDAPKRKMVPAKKPVVAAPPAPQEPQIYRVEAIRAAKRTEEAVH